MDFDSILFAKYLEGGGAQLKLFFDQTVSTWDGQAGNNFYCTDYISISKSPNKVVVEYDGTKYNCTKELDEEFGSYYYGAEYDAQNDTLDFSKYPFRAWFSDEDETLISLMAPDDQTHTFKIYEVKSGGGSSVDVEALSVTENGTYTAEEGKAYSPVTVNVSGLTLKGVAEKTEPSGVIDVTGFSLGAYCFNGYKNITKVQGSPSGSNGTGYQSFAGCTGITSVNLTAQKTEQSSFQGCTNLVNAVIITDTANDVGTNLFHSCTKLEVADLTIKRLRTNFFYNDNALSTLVLRSTTITGLENAGVLGNNVFKNGGSGGEVYIPKSLYDHLGDNSSSDYKHATNWTTIDGYGTITWKKIEGSYYETHYADGTEITA